MKIAHVLLFFLIPFIGMANPVKGFSSLEKNDWIQFELVGYDPCDSPTGEIRVPWEVKNLQKLSFKVTVLDRKKDQLLVSFSIDRITGQKEQPEYNGISYYDSWYGNDFTNESNSLRKITPITPNTKEITFLPEQNFLQAAYNEDNGQLIHSSLGEELAFVYPALSIVNGIYSKKSQRDNTATMIPINISGSLTSAVSQFITKWIAQDQLNRSIPFSVSLPDLPSLSEIRITNASFALPSNVKLTYLYPEKKSGKQQKMTQNFFLAIPAKYTFADKEWLVTPGDSIVLEEDQTGNCLYSGTGAIKNNLKYELNQNSIFSSNYNFQETSPEKIASYLKNWDQTYYNIYNKYAGQIDPWWNTSFSLSKKYYHAYVQLFACNIRNANQSNADEQVDWSSEIFSTLSPMTDYLYLPNGMSLFLQSFVNYKTIQITNDNLTRLHPLWANYQDIFHLQNIILSGYPKFCANADVLKTLMSQQTLSSIRPEYNAFITECPDSSLRTEVEKKHTLYAKIEPGAWIQNAGIPQINTAEFKKKDRHTYLLISISLIPAEDQSNQQSLNLLTGQLTKDKLSGKVQIQLDRPESVNGYQLPDSIQSMYRLLPYDSLASIYKTTGGISVTLLIRGDGKILYRSLDPFSWYSDEIIEQIEKDMNTKEPATAGSWFLLGLVVMLGISVITGICLYIRIKIRQKKERTSRLMAELELKALRSQMNPHFIFNALSSIQNLINRPDPELANQYLLNFAKLLRMVLSASNKKLISLSEEIEQLRLYIGLEQLRVPFQVNFRMEQTVNPETIEIPGMLIQPLIENAVKHGIVPHGGGEIEIFFKQKDSILEIIIKDDGPGLTSSVQTENNGFGLKAVKERLMLIKEEFHTGISLRIENEINKTGCVVTMTIPLE